MKNISIFCGAHKGKNPKYAEEAKLVAKFIAKKIYERESQQALIT